ncbi:MAG TPA: biotin/lipoyl-containing protein, partial [Caldimonas sp.]|nr:biotin/lipoyl-containing protein [Caldimonas sp.]
MALIEVKVPQLAESVAEATLLQWKKKPGEAVEMDEILIEIETDKVVLEVPAPAAGVLAQVIKNDGDSCISEEVIAKIDTEGEESVSGAMQIRSVPEAEPALGETPGVSPQVAARAETKSEVAMPAAAKLMAELDIPVGAVQGTGRGGRVTKGDVFEALDSGMACAP